MGNEPNNMQKPNLPEGLHERLYTAEAYLLARLFEKEKELEDVLVNLVALYSRAGRQDLSMSYLERLLGMASNAEKKANCYLMLGQIMEQTGNFEEAIQFYKKALSLEPTDTNVWYLVNNNLEYCLNNFSKFEDAEPYCREAIKIDPGRYNAYKNLGISLQGMGKYREATRNLIKSVETNPLDNRAFSHLLELVNLHPEVATEIPDIKKQVERCRKLVQRVGYSSY